VRATPATRPSPATSRALPLRVVPPVLLSSRRAGRLIERNALVYRHAWIIVFSGFFEPVFYLFSVRLGIGDLVGGVPVDGRTVAYTAFAAPALLASSAMNGAVYESTMNIFFKLKFAKTYDGILATPMGPGDVALGEICWCLLRGTLYGAGFLVVMAAMGLVESWWGVLLLPTAVLIGFAFSAVGMAATSFMRSWQDFDMVQLVVLPLFLFSATFYPLSTYPYGLEWVVRLTPLYQGVDLMRSLSLGTVGADAVAHVAYLLTMGLVGLAVSSRRLERLLLQ
jgi:lipooligosaccharide transport system permease protein